MQAVSAKFSGYIWLPCRQVFLTFYEGVQYTGYMQGIPKRHLRVMDFTCLQVRAATQKHQNL